MGRVVLVLFDIDRHGQIEHAVAYDQADGHLTALLGSFDPGPFSTLPEVVRWLQGVLKG